MINFSDPLQRFVSQNEQCSCTYSPGRINLNNCNSSQKLRNIPDKSHPRIVNLTPSSEINDSSDSVV